MRFAPFPLPSRGPVVLGVCPGARRVGLAVLDAQELLHHQVLNLYQIRSREGKEARFRQIVANLVDAHHVGHVAVTTPASGESGHAALRANLLLWLTAHAASRQIPIRHLDAMPVRAALLASARRRANNRNLAELLAHRFTELHSLAPSGRQAPWVGLAPELGNRRRLPTAHELYWRWMFIALGGALLTRDHIIRTELDK